MLRPFKTQELGKHYNEVEEYVLFGFEDKESMNHVVNNSIKRDVSVEILFQDCLDNLSENLIKSLEIDLKFNGFLQYILDMDEPEWLVLLKRKIQ